MNEYRVSAIDYCEFENNIGSYTMFVIKSSGDVHQNEMLISRAGIG
jgi:hypothetical protein